MTDDANTKLYVTKMIEKLVTLGSSHTYCTYITYILIHRAGNLLIRSFAHLLISLKSNQQLRAIRLDRSRQMSDRERIAQVAQRK